MSVFLYTSWAPVRTVDFLTFITPFLFLPQRERRENSALRPDLSVNSFPEGSLIPDYREPEPPLSNGKKYHASLKNLIPIRFSSGSICLSYASTDDDASFNLSVIMSHILFILFHIHELTDCCDCESNSSYSTNFAILASWSHRLHFKSIYNNKPWKKTFYLHFPIRSLCFRCKSNDLWSYILFLQIEPNRRCRILLLQLLCMDDSHDVEVV